MKPIDANTETYERFEILGQEALFTSARIDRATLPSGLYAYDLRDNDNCSGEPCELKTKVLVNHWGTVIVKNPIDGAEGGIILTEDDYGYLDEDMTLEQFIADTSARATNNIAIYKLDENNDYISMEICADNVANCDLIVVKNNIGLEWLREHCKNVSLRRLNDCCNNVNQSLSSENTTLAKRRIFVRRQGTDWVDWMRFCDDVVSKNNKIISICDD